MGAPIMIRFWGQSKFSVEPLSPISYEFFLREKDGDSWVLPQDFSQFPPSQIADLLLKTVPAIQKNFKEVSINLDPEQFIDQGFCQALHAIKAQLQPIILSVELTEHPANPMIYNQQILAAAKNFYHAGIHLIVDDVGFGDNQIERVRMLNPFVHEYKFAIQNFRSMHNMDQVIPALNFWNHEASVHHKLFTVEGIENRDDLKMLIDYHVDMLQGFGLGHPVYLPTISERHANSVLPFKI